MGSDRIEGRGTGGRKNWIGGKATQAKAEEEDEERKEEKGRKTHEQENRGGAGEEETKRRVKRTGKKR